MMMLSDALTGLALRLELGETTPELAARRLRYLAAMVRQEAVEVEFEWCVERRLRSAQADTHIYDSLEDDT